MLHSGSGGQGCPLATGPSGLEPEPKAPGKAWREDARHPQGLSTGTANSAARQPLGLSTDTANIAARQMLGLSTGTANSAARQMLGLSTDTANSAARHRWDYPPTTQISPLY